MSTSLYFFNHLNRLILTTLINSCQTSGISKVGAIIKSIILAVDRRSIAYPHENCQRQIAFYLWFRVIDICGNRKRKSTAFQKYNSCREANCFIHTYPTQTRFALACCLHRQSSLLRGYRPLMKPTQENKLHIYCTMLNFISVSFCNAYIIVTFRVRVEVWQFGVAVTRWS